MERRQQIPIDIILLKLLGQRILEEAKVSPRVGHEPIDQHMGHHNTHCAPGPTNLAHPCL